MRSSTRATSLGSERAQYEPGRFAGSSSMKVPASTSCLHEQLELGVGAVEPVDVVGLAELDHLVDPREQSGVRRVGACTQRHVELLQDDGVEVRLDRGKRGADELYRRAVPTPEPRTGGGTRRRSDLGGGEAHVGLGADAHRRGPAVVVEVEVDALALAQHPEERALERVGARARARRGRCRARRCPHPSAGRTCGRRPARSTCPTASGPCLP